MLAAGGTVLIERLPKNMEHIMVKNKKESTRAQKQICLCLWGIDILESRETDFKLQTILKDKEENHSGSHSAERYEYGK